MILRIDIDQIEIGIPIDTLRNFFYLLPVFRIGKLLIMIEREVIRFTCYPIGFTDQVEIAVEATFRTNNRTGSQSRNQIGKVKLRQKARYQMLNRKDVTLSDPVSS